MPDLNRYLDIRSAGAGRTTADGSTIVFVTNITGIPQAWAMPRGGGWPRQLTFADGRVGGVAPSPSDPSLVVFTRDDGGNERMQIHAVDPAGFGERDLVTDAEVIHRFGTFGPDGTWFVYLDNSRNGVDFDLFVADLDGGRRLVAEMSGWNAIADVSPDGTKALVGHFTSNMDGTVWLVDLATGTVEDLTPHEGIEMNAPVGFDESGAVFGVSDRGGEYRRAVRITETEGRRSFGPEHADIDTLAIEGDVGVIGWNEGGRTRLAWFDPATLELTAEITLPVGVAGDAEVSPDGASVTFGFSGAAHPADVWRVATGSSSPERVTESSTAGIDPATFAEPDLATVTSFDGLEVPVWVYRPEGVSTPPVVVSVHGGPEAQERVGFNPLYQYLVSAGYAVVAPNVRGSSGYGKSYMGLDDRRKRMDSVRDLEAVGRWVAAGPFDASRIVVFGGSYGGFMVLAALATCPDLWAAGVDVVGIANFVTFLENTGAYRRALREAEYGSLAEDREFLEAISPTSMVDRITAPLLVIHGANDPRVPLGEATQIVERLRELDRTVDLVVFDDEGHGIVKLANRRMAYGRMVEFLEEVLD